MSIHDAIAEAQARHREEEAEQHRRHLAWEREWQANEARKNRDVLPNTRPTTVGEYAAFVRGYLKAGGQIRYVRDCPLRDDYRTVTDDLTMPALYGAATIDLLVPEGRTVEFPEGHGHATVLWMDGFRLEGAGLELFSDVASYLQFDR